MSITTLTSLDSASTQFQTETVRAELKAWEKSFAAANEGRKAGREDIKKNPEIAEKYRLYNKLRAFLSAPTSATSPSFAAQTQIQGSSPSHAVPSKKRKRSSAEIDPGLPRSRTSKQSRQRPPPPQPPNHPAALDSYDPPSNHATPTAPRTFVGPTPQKNGLVLGLFDLLSPRSGGTPSKSDMKPNVNAEKGMAGKRRELLATPSKARHEGGTVGGTPGSKSRLNPESAMKGPSAAVAGEFVTPSARRTLHLQGTPGSRVSRLKFASDETPEFLRRTAPLRPTFHSADSNARNSQSQNAAGDNEGDDEVSWSPVAVRLPRKPAGRCLSALVRGLRNMEEEKLDEDLDLLREVEREELGAPIPIPILKRPRIQVRDSQVQLSDHMTTTGHGEGEVEMEMPLGADGEREGDQSSESDVEQLGRDGRKLRVWKKKGQKRSTRRVVMRPTVGRWKPEAEWVCGVVEEGQGEKGLVRDTQTGGGEGEEDGGGEGEDWEDRDEGADQDGGKETGGKKAKKAKTVSATAHANFRALKIRNKQSKGKGKGRFGRRNK